MRDGMTRNLIRRSFLALRNLHYYIKTEILIFFDCSSVIFNTNLIHYKYEHDPKLHSSYTMHCSHRWNVKGKAKEKKRKQSVTN